ncbi:unnamed protein product [Orchesella dallaii]|uniref:Rho GTPase-activating protein 21 n=1 Tax=Orchesella dallaii TaxID=48710 RepID=A0ABP1Q9Y1_9HEXA
MDSDLLTSQGFLGLRCVRIPRCQNGFGFTLRHFIVYPPELYSEDGEADETRHSNGFGQSRLHKVTEPVDTIFVKSVRDNSPSAYAGLCVGDRIVSVNGETIVGKSYDQVVSLIQKTRDLLCLEVSPKQYDTLQLFYEEQAYRPETNQRPYEPLKVSSSADPLCSYPKQQRFHPGSNSQLPNEYSYANPFFDATDCPRRNMSSSHSSHPQAQFFSHLPRPIPYKSSAVWDSTSERNGEPTYSTALSGPSKGVQQRQQPQAYYPFNHSFDKSTLWKVRERDDPSSGAKSADSILGESCGDNVIYRSPLRSESMECLSGVNIDVNHDIALQKAGPGYRYSISSTTKAHGPGTSQPSDYRNTMVVTMSSTNAGQNSRHANEAIHYAGTDGVAPNSLSGYENQIVDRIRRSCEQKEEFLRRPNQPFQWGPFRAQPSPPFPKELYAQPQKFTKVPWPPANILPAVTSIKPPLTPNVTDNRNYLSRNDKRSKSNNVTVISVQHSGPDSISSGSSCRPETSNSDSWSPIDRHSESEVAPDGHKYSDGDLDSREVVSPSKILSMYELPRNRLTVVGSRKLHCDPPPDWKPDLASLTGYQNQQTSSRKITEERKETLFPPDCNETDMDVQTSTDNVILRKREAEPESESERLVRRVSYLKATSSPIDMERKSTSPTSPVKSPTSEYPSMGSSKSDKFADSTESIRDGKVHFKIRIGENKRGTYNRSWRQGWAQARRSGYLYLSKERLQKEAVTGSEESVIISVSIRDGVLIEPADDYTKRKNVLRIRTSFVPDDESNFPFVATTEYFQNSVSLNPSSPQLTIEVLIQAEDPNDLILWLHCFQKQLENNNCNEETCNNIVSKGVVFGSEFYPKSKSFLTSLLPSPGTPIQTSNQSERTTGSGGALSAANSLNPNTVATMANTAASPKAKTWKGKVAKQWKKVHDIIDTNNTSTDNKSSSPYASLPPAGVTFGINLENCPPGELNPYIPRVIEYSIDLVERKGIEMVGLYRIPGNNASVAILTDRLNRGEDPNPEKDARWLDVHVVASLIKSFLRRLPDPLLTNDRYAAFIQAADENEETCLMKIKELIKGLPTHNFETLKAVVSHLKHVAEKGESNRMDARNLAIVFGPTIVRTAGENFSSMVADMKNQCKIVEALVIHADHLFTDTTTTSNPVVMRQTSRERPRHETHHETSDVRKSADVSKPLSPSPPVPTIEKELKVSLIKAAKRKVSAKENQPIFEHQKSLPADPKPELCKPVDEKGFIRSYAGLNEVTERRIRNFELETRAMLSRDDRSPNSSVFNIGAGSNKPVKVIDDIKEQQLKLDDALRRAKDDLETEDIYDQIADNPSSIVHHRERGFGLCASSPGPFTLSNSSLSSSNSNSTAPTSLLTSSLPAWPTGNRNGPTPFRNSMPPQSLPPKPPSTTSNSSYPSSFDTVSPNAQLRSNSIRRVNSFDRIQDSQSPCADINDSTSNFKQMNSSTKNSFRRIRRNDGTFVSGGTNTKQLGGSLDSLKDIAAETAMLEEARLRTIRIGNEGSCDDLSPRSSDGSDMVTTLTKTFDKKLQKLRTQYSESSLKTNQNEDLTKETVIQKDNCTTAHNTDKKTSLDVPETISYNEKQTLVPIYDQIEIDQSNCSIPNNFIKKGRRRHSLIERRKSSFEGASKDTSAQSDITRSNTGSNADSNNTSDNPSDVVKASKPKKLSKECRRRHSLSGATDILSLVFRGSEKLSVHRDSDIKKNKTLSSEALLTALKNASILESHV